MNRGIGVVTGLLVSLSVAGACSSSQSSAPPDGGQQSGKGGGAGGAGMASGGTGAPNGRPVVGGTGSTSPGSNGSGGNRGNSDGGIAGAGEAAAGHGGTGGIETTGAAGAAGGPSVACAGPSPTATWSATTPASGPAALGFTALSGSGPSDVWAVGTGFVGAGTSQFSMFSQAQQWGGAAWTAQLTTTPNLVSDVWAAAPTDVWVSGTNLEHWNGQAFSAATTPPVVSSTSAVWGLNGNDVWAGGRNVSDLSLMMLNWQGTSWTPSPVIDSAQFDLAGIWGASANDVWAVGDFPASNPFVGIWHWNGSAWSLAVDGRVTASFEQGELSAVWGSAANDVWAVGLTITGSSDLWHFNGAAWSHVATPPIFGQLFGVWGTCAGNVWAVGETTDQANQVAELEHGIVLHFDGTTWSVVNTGISPLPNLHSVWTDAASDVWVAGDTETLLHLHQ
jgi:hypothetical protein